MKPVIYSHGTNDKSSINYRPTEQVADSITNLGIQINEESPNTISRSTNLFLDLIDLLKKLLEWQVETSWKTQVYIVDSNSKMYIEIIYKLILQVTNYYNKIYE